MHKKKNNVSDSGNAAGKDQFQNNSPQTQKENKKGKKPSGEKKKSSGGKTERTVGQYSGKPGRSKKDVFAYESDFNFDPELDIVPGAPFLSDMSDFDSEGYAPKAPVHVRQKRRDAAAEKSGTDAAGAENRSAGNKKNAGTEKNKPRGGKEKKVRVIPLGGLGEIGKNMTVVEYGDDMLVIDCGLGFPEEDMPGIDLVIPDFSYLEANREKLRGVVLTHGHEDHVGAIPYFLRSFNVPIYGTALTIGIIRNRLIEHKLNFKPQLNVVKAGDRVRLGMLEAEFIHVNHSIADACAIAISTPVGTLVHTGDFKLDVSPIEGDMMDVARLGEIGKRGVKLLMCESTNAERAGFTPSERSVGGALENVFAANTDKRIVVATFSSNVHRVQQIINISVKHGRRVAVSGRSMQNIVAAAIELGYMKPPEGTLIDVADIKRYAPGQITLVTTGSQGEPMSALYRMAFNDHSQVTLGPQDVVVLSSSAIPGNEKLIGRIINELAHNGIKVIYDGIFFGVHASGHACAEELKFMQALLRPKYFMPVHGEERHLCANRDLALFMGTPADRIFVGELGRVLEIGKNSAGWGETVPAGRTLIDGLGVGDIGSAVLRDRKHLSEDGIVIVFASVDLTAHLIITAPEIISKGFVYVPDSEDLIYEAKLAAAEELTNSIERRSKYSNIDMESLKERVRREVLKVLVSRTGRNPIVIPLITEL
ncbi:MAG: ribonuclease J [Clostridia bacterium]|nr:ribonuclease J [Clostridia bacterium]